MGPRNILIVGNYGAGNLGDDAILGGIVEELRLGGFKGSISVMHGGVTTGPAAISSSPEIYRGLKKVPFYPAGFRSFFKREQKKAALRAIEEADLVILGGGGLFTDAESAKAPFIWAAQARAIRKVGKPYIIFGQSVGPLHHWWARALAKKTFLSAKAVHVRDASSAEFLSKWGIQAKVGTDPAFLWLLMKKRPVPKKPVVLVNFRTWPGYSSKQWAEWLKEIIIFCKKRRWKPILLLMETVEMEAAKTKSSESQNLVWKQMGLEIFEPLSALQAFEGIQKASLLIGMRLHANLFALAGGTPHVVLSYSSKVADLYQSLNLKNGPPILEASTLSGTKLREALKHVHSQTVDNKVPQVNFEELLTQNQEFLAPYLRNS